MKFSKMHKKSRRHTIKLEIEEALEVSRDTGHKEDGRRSLTVMHNLAKENFIWGLNNHRKLFFNLHFLKFICIKVLVHMGVS